MSSWRLLGLDVEDAYTNMAIDEAILRAKSLNAVPNTLRFFRWKPSAVSIGRFQDLFKEVFVETCRDHGVDLVRRISGGGAVYHDYEGEITYSVVVDGRSLGLADLDVARAYKRICGGLIEGARILGTHAEFNPRDRKQCPNLTVKGRKISGSAQSYKRGILLQHGTFLVNIDLKKMFTYLRVPWAKTPSEVWAVSKRKLTSAAQELASAVTMDEAYEALVKGFAKALKVDLVEGELTPYEKQLAESLRETKFSMEEWNLNGSMM